MSRHTPADIVQQILKLSVEGVPGRQISRDLGIPETTVRDIKKRGFDAIPDAVGFPHLAATRHERIEAGFQQAPGDKPEDFYADIVPNVPISNTPIRVLAIGDAHDDLKISKERFRWIGKHAVAMQPDHIIWIGDIADFESLSFHSPNASNNGKFKPRFLADINSLNQAMEAAHEPMEQAGLKVREDVTLGNHENRIWRYEDQFPETAGMLQRDFFDVLHRYNMHGHQYGKYINLSGVSFTHSPFSVMGKPIGGMTAANTIARQASGDMVYGHTHKANVVTNPRIGGESKVTVIDLGCALPQGYVFNYAKHTMTGWSWGVWELIILNGTIQGYNMIPMFELERRYGK